VIVLGKNQVDARALEIAVEKQLSIRDNYRVRRRMRTLPRNRLDVGLVLSKKTQTVGRMTGIDFAGVIQRGTAKTLMKIIRKNLSLHIIKVSIRKPFLAWAIPMQSAPHDDSEMGFACILLGFACIRRSNLLHKDC